jgi:hypothetical protein
MLRLQPLLQKKLELERSDLVPHSAHVLAVTERRNTLPALGLRRFLARTKESIDPTRHALTSQEIPLLKINRLLPRVQLPITNSTKHGQGRIERFEVPLRGKDAPSF